MGSDRRTFFNQLVSVGALSGLATMLPSDAFATIEKSLLSEESEGKGIQIRTADGVLRTYLFHAHAHSLGTDARFHTSVHLPEEGGFQSRFSENYDSGDGVSFKAAYVHVAGTRSTKPGYGWVSLATAFVAGLNVRDVVTADLVFAEVSSEHPLIGHVPSVSFLGTRFQNLRIAGREVAPTMDLNLLGPKPSSEKPYVQDAVFLAEWPCNTSGLLARRGFPIPFAGSTIGILLPPGSRAEWNALSLLAWKTRLPVHPMATSWT